MLLVQAPTTQQILDDAGVMLRCKMLNIGDWDMDNVGSVTVAHGLTLDDIRNVTGWIRNDAGDTYYPITMGSVTVGVPDCYVASIDATNITLNAFAGGAYDNANFNLTPYNRGWLYVWYVI